MTSQTAAGAQGLLWGALRGFWELIGETRRVKPAGTSNLLVAGLSVVATVAISYYALFAHATQHYQVSIFFAPTSSVNPVAAVYAGTLCSIDGQPVPTHPGGGAVCFVVVIEYSAGAVANF